ncbi:cysteine hydrolase family protein [Streptomyces sp. 8N114]|uniref:cysteine hydrolase family protein n=1 Tax=Streptomyces sp. 8N114 TaxID=3457419 RepID=UPI003FD2044B
MPDTALLAMDLQQGHVPHIPDPGYLARVASAIGAARAAGIPVVHVAFGLRPGHPEVHPHNRMLSSFAPEAFTDSDPAAAIHPDVAPLDGEIVVTKNRASAFSGNDLRQILAANGIDHLVLAGIATGGVVLATTCQAADLDYRLTFLADGCADPDPELHQMLIERVFPRRGDVTSIDHWTRAMG